MAKKIRIENKINIGEKVSHNKINYWVFFGWFFGIISIFNSINYIFETPIFGFIMLFLSFVILPPIYILIKQKIGILNAIGWFFSILLFYTIFSIYTKNILSAILYFIGILLINPYINSKINNYKKIKIKYLVWIGVLIIIFGMLILQNY